MGYILVGSRLRYVLYGPGQFSEMIHISNIIYCIHICSINTIYHDHPVRDFSYRNTENKGPKCTVYANVLQGISSKNIKETNPIQNPDYPRTNTIVQHRQPHALARI